MASIEKASNSFMLHTHFGKVSATQQFPVHNVDAENIRDIAPVEAPRQPLKEIEPWVTVDARGSKRGRGHFWARGGRGTALSKDQIGMLTWRTL